MMKKIPVLNMIIVIGIVVLAVLVLQVPGRISLPVGQPGNWSVEDQLEYANQLMVKGLKKQAAQALEDYLTAAGRKERKELAKTAYLLGNLYLELYEYEKALSYYFRAEMLDKNAGFIAELNQKVIAALEKAGMTTQAQYELKTRTALEKPEEKMGNIIAKVGDEEITETDINNAMDRMPEWLRKNYETEGARYDFIKQYVASEVLYLKAKRLGLDNNTAAREFFEQVKKQFAVEQLLKQEIEKELKITPDDLKLYYNANKDKYVEEVKGDDGKTTKRQKEFNEVKNQVEYEYRQKKQQALTQSLLEKALEEQIVEIFYQLPKSDVKNPAKESDAAVDQAEK
ncbi:MAG: hypothetical protein ABH952_06345 [Candidatus Omnitrophota bacterium]